MPVELDRRAARAAGALLTALGIAAIGLATLRPGDPAVLEPHGHWCLVCGSYGGTDVLSNILLFLPFGAGLGVLGLSWRRAALVALATTLGVELTQAFVLTGRAATISDVVTNVTGALLAHAIVVRWRSILFPTPRAAGRLVTAWLVLWVGAIWMGRWLLEPYFMPGPYYLQMLPPESASERAFEGAILDARIGGIPIRPMLEPAGGAADRALASGRPALAATVVPQSYAPGMFRPIVSVHDRHWQGQVQLGQRQRDLMLSYHANARRLRLRAPAVRLADVFPATDDRGPAKTTPLALSAELNGREVHLTSTSPLAEHRLSMALSPLHAWTTVLPVSLDSRPLTGAITTFYAACWMLPLGFWLVSFGRGQRRAGIFAVLAAAATLALLGLAGARPQVAGVLAPLLLMTGSGLGVLAHRYSSGGRLPEH